GGVVVHVGDGSERQVHADGAAFERGDAADLVRGGVAAGGAHAHIGRQWRSPGEPKAGAALEVGCDQQRKARALLQSIELGGDVQGRADGDDQAADVQRVHPGFGPGESFVVVRGVVARNPRDHELRDLVAHRERAHQLVDVDLARDTLGRWERHRMNRNRRRGTASPQQYHYEREVLGMHRSLVLLGLCGWSLGCGPPGPGAPAAAPVGVRPGIEVLLADSAHLVRDRRVGLVTNQAGVDANGVSDVVRLRTAGIRLVALFSPEHGFRGAADPGAAVASSVDSATGLPIYSLYGRTSAPT